jgi:hypothetical protein
MIDRFSDWYNERETITQIILAFIGMMIILGLLTFIVMLIAWSFEAYKCYVYSIQMKIQTSYSWWTGCMWNIDGVWRPDEYYRMVEITQ